MRPRSKARRALFIWLAVLTTALGCKRDQPPAAQAPDKPAQEGGGLAAPGPVTTEKTPDGQSLIVTFPGKPEWTDVPGLEPQTNGFVWRGDEKHKPCAAWVWTVPANERNTHTNEELSYEYAKRAACVGDSAFFFYGQHASGVGRGGWQSKPFEEWDRRPGTKDSGAGTVLVVGNKVYCLRVTGSELAVSDPECKPFFDSLKPVELKDRPAVAKAPADDLRPLARDGSFPNLAAVGVHTTGIAFCLGRKAAFRTTYAYTPDWDETSGRLKRYRYPTFQPDGEYKLPRISSLIGSDDARNRLYLHIGRGPDAPARLARFDVPERLGAGKQEVIGNLKSMDLTEPLGSVVVAPDGRHLFSMRSDPRGKVDVIRIDAEEMKKVGTPLPLADKTMSLCASPDGKTLYAGVETSVVKGSASTEISFLVQEVDVPTWKIRRTFTVRGQAGVVACGGDGRLYILGEGGYVRVDPTVAGEPTVQRVSTNDSYRSFVLSPDAKRLYATNFGSHPYSLDAKELFDFGRQVIAPESMKEVMARQFGQPNRLKGVREREAYSAAGIISADGKCLFLSSGHIFWLAGAGPLPDADPAVRWNP